MKNILVLFLICSSILLDAQTFSSTDPAYIDNVNAGEAKLITTEYDSCVIYYAKAFEIKQTSFLSLMRGAACAHSAGQDDIMDQWMSKAIENSWGGAKQIFDNYDQFDYLRGTDFEKTLNNKYQKAAEAAGVDFELMAEFDGIRETDQKWRRLMRDTTEAYGWDSPQMTALWKEQSYHDSLNTARIEEVIKEVGSYPGKSLVGDGHASTAFLVIQHADLEVQERYLDLMRDAADAGEVRWASIALLVDRVNLRKGNKQIYGSQVSRDPETEESFFSPIEMPYKVDSIRATVGLGPIQQYADNWDFTYDVAAHQKIWEKLEAKKKADEAEKSALENNEVLQKVEELPRFPGCEEVHDSAERTKCSNQKLISFISEHLKYPKKARKKKTEGKALVQFVVEKDGSISNITLLKDLENGCGQAAVEVVKKMNEMSKMWIPGVQGGETVRVQFTLPFNFRLPK